MNIPLSSDAFTIERHEDLIVISATPALETLEEGVEEQAAQLIMGLVSKRPGKVRC